MTTTTVPIEQEANDLISLQASRDEAKSAYDELALDYKIAEARLIERMQADGVQGIKLEGKKNVVPAETAYGVVQDRSEFVAWAEENDESLLEKKERKILINELVRERLDNGEVLPPGLGFYLKQYISLRAA